MKWCTSRFWWRSVGIANLTLPGTSFLTQGTSAMKPANPSLQNEGQLNATTGR